MSTVPTPTTALTVDEINPASFDFWLRDDVEGALAKLRNERPVAWHQHPDSGKGFWSITRFDDVAAATRDWETFSSAYGIQAMTDPEDMQYMGAIRSMISTDPPKHTKLRGVVNRGFTPKMIAKAEGAVRQRARRIVDTIAPKGEAEFVTEVADALPVAIICDMMGVPEGDRAKLLDLTNRLLAGGDRDFGGTRESLLQAASELREYGLWLGKKRLELPENDLTTTLVHAEVDGEAMPPEDLAFATIFGVKPRFTTPRSLVCFGGSVEIIDRMAPMYGMSSGSVIAWIPYAELKVSQSRVAAATSSKRVIDQKPLPESGCWCQATDRSLRSLANAPSTSSRSQKSKLAGLISSRVRAVVGVGTVLMRGSLSPPMVKVRMYRVG